MNDLLVAAGLILTIEGVLYALFPDFMRRMAAHVLQTPVDTLRVVGLISASLGVVVVWFVRG